MIYKYNMALSQYPRLNIGDGSRDSGRRGLKLGVLGAYPVIQLAGGIASGV